MRSLSQLDQRVQVGGGEQGCGAGSQHDQRAYGRQQHLPSRRCLVRPDVRAGYYDDAVLRMQPGGAGRRRNMTATATAPR